MSGWITPQIKGALEMLASPEYERRWMAELGYTRTLPTETLKQIWDSYDGISVNDPRTSGEAVHTVLNERGDGQYCAV